MTTISGQKAVATYSTKDISNFKLRKGVAIGVRVTLRGDHMYEFLDQINFFCLPRIRDFKGINEKGFDGSGNYTLGVTEQIIFPEIDIDKVSKINGMDITFVTSAKTDKEAKTLIKRIRFPIQKVKNLIKKRYKMAKESMKARDAKRAKLTDTYADKRAALKAAGDSAWVYKSYQEILQKYVCVIVVN
jgi:hypothetical protein